MKIKPFLNKHWKPIVFFSLLLGLIGWIFHTDLILYAWRSNTFGKWVAQVDYNAYGEGIYELFLFPSITVFIGIGVYVFYKKMTA